MPPTSTRKPLALAGASVIVTRPAASARALVRGARARGAEVVRLPGMRLLAVDDADGARRQLERARQADIWVFTSPSAVVYGLSLLGSNRFPDNLRMCAVGAGTARALARNGIASIAPAGLHNSEGLLDEPMFSDVGGLHVVLIDAPGGRDLLANTLAERGAGVEHVAVYQRAPPRLSGRYLAALRAAERPWISLLSSGLALSNLLEALPAELSARWRSESLVVSSTRLKEQAQERGFTDVHEADSALTRDLLRAAGQVLARHRL